MTIKNKTLNNHWLFEHQPLKSGLVLFLVAFSLLINMPATTDACTQAQSCSTSYQVNQVFMGSGGALNDCSSSYCAKESSSETTVGKTSSSSYQAQAGFNTNRSPSLTLIVNATNVNLGVLHSGTTATTTATFSVESYLTSGYVVTTDSPPPQDSGYSLHALTTAAASNSSQEQFGMNLVANTTACGAPANFGSNPVQVPSSAYSFGQAANGYNTCGLFQYNDGNIIADSPKSSGQTNYTISYIFNVTNLTPAGVYSFNQVLVATSKF